MKILVVEDEQLLADSIGELLRDKGFEADVVYDGETGAQYAELGVYDLLILDVMLPGLDGYRLARRVRAARLGVPILMLTARSALEDRVTGLDAGADYYLSFEIDEGQVYGFLGPNGAGKSTTMNIMTGCLSATGGSVRIDGYDIFEQPDQAKRRIGYLPEQPPLYMNETPEEYLRFVGQAKGLRGHQLARQIEAVIEQTRIGDVRGRCIAALSKGYRQRVGIAQALLGDPRVIILDEPTVGLDPLQIIEIRDLIRQLGQSHTVILSSHILSEVQAICDKILIIAKGRLVAFDDPASLEKQLSSQEIALTAEADAEQTRAILRAAGQAGQAQLTEAAPGRTAVSIQVDQADPYQISRSLFFAFADRRVPLLELAVKKANLEDIFIQLTEAAPARSEEKEAN